MIKTLSISLLLAIGLIFSGYMIGNKHDVYNLETIKTEPIIQTEIYWQTETVEKIVEIYPDLREFESRGELVNWLSTQTKPQLNGTCIDYCYDLMRKAQSDGYYMYMREITPSQYKDWFNTDWTIGTNHAVCTVIDVNDSQCVYVIDATSSYKIYPEDGYYESIRLSN